MNVPHYPQLRFRRPLRREAGGIDLGHDAVCRGEAEGTATGEPHRVDRVDESARVEEVGLAGAGPAAAHVHPGRRARRWHHRAAL